MKAFQDMNIWDKLTIYFDYYITQLEIRATPIFMAISEPKELFLGTDYSPNTKTLKGITHIIEWNHGWGKPEKGGKYFAVYYPNKNSKIYSFEDFCNESKNPYYKGFVPIKEWYSKFYDRIKFTI